MNRVFLNSISFVFLWTSSAFCQSNDTKIVCFGDSITKRGYPEIIAEKLKVQVINSGVAGHTSSQGLRRMKKDVLDHEPDIVVVFFGTNDIRVDSVKHVPLKQYRKNLEEIAESCRNAGARVIFCTPPPIHEAKYFRRHNKKDYEKKGGLAKLLGDNQEAVRKVGKAKKVPVVDLAEELERQPIWMHQDGVHPSPTGNILIAQSLIELLRPMVESIAEN